MKVFKKSILVGFLIISQISLFGQKVSKIYDLAEDFFYSENPLDALPMYLQVTSSDPNYEDAAYKAELSLLLSKDREKSLDRLFELSQTQGKNDRFFNYWLGRIYLSRYEFTKAVDTWNSFLQAKSSKSQEIIEETKEFINNTRKMISFFENTDNYEIRQIGGQINTEAAELAPAYFADKEELLFASSRGSSPENEVFKIYHSIKQSDGWSDLAEISILGQFTRLTANLEVVNEDGKLFIFDPKNGGDLFYSEVSNGKWVLPVEFDNKVTSTHLKSHFYINEHEDRIIFSTDKNYKTNRLDLYQTFKDPNSQKWSKPAAFADVINSTLDEDFPYLSDDESTLYFSSRGHGSIGGYDVFKTEYNSEDLTWSEPENMGFPINSPDDEIYFKINNEATEGYFSSNRLHTKGDFDIYLFWQIEKVNIEGRIFDMLTEKVVSDATIRFTPSQYTDVHFDSKVDDKGKYRTEIISQEVYLVEIIKDNKVIFTDEFEISETGGIATTHTKDFLLNQSAKKPAEPIVSKELPPTEKTTVAQVDQDIQNNNRNLTNVTKDGKETSQINFLEGNNPTVNNRPKQGNNQAPQPVNYKVGGKIIVRNVYFDFGTSSINRYAPSILDELYKFLVNNPSIKVEIGGHTDNIGNEKGNMWMSENRAKNIRNWLINKGIKAERLVARGYGSSKPLASNDDEKEGRELNRRIEIRIIN